MVGLLVEVLMDEAPLVSPAGPGPLGVRQALDEALTAADLGEVSGGHAVAGQCAVDLELDDEERLDEAVALIRRVLRGLGLPANAAINRVAGPWQGPSESVPARTGAEAVPTLPARGAGRDFERGRAAS